MGLLFTPNPVLGFDANPYAPGPVQEDTGGQIQGEGKPALRRGVKTHCPNRPGIYAMLDQHNHIIYVGKAKKLRARLLNYFRTSSGERHKARRLLRRTQTILWEYAPHELSALLRELELIRKHKPRFNVMGQPLLRRRAYVCLGRSPAPYAFVANEPPSKGVDWFGPLIARPEIHQAVRHLNDLFLLRDCPKQQTMQFADQPPLLDVGAVSAGCIRYEMGTCLGPCARLCSAAQYRYRVQSARRFLKCDDPSTLEEISRQMQQAAQTQDYEKAGVLRDRYQDLDWLLKTLIRLRKTREELSFVYQVHGAGGENLWFLIHEGRVHSALSQPQGPKEKAAGLQLLNEIYYAPPRVGIPLEVIDHVWIVAAWFRKFPQEKEKCITVEEAIKLLK